MSPHKFLPRTSAGWVVVALAVFVVVPLPMALGISLLARLWSTTGLSVSANNTVVRSGGMLMLASAIASGVVGWIVIARGRDRARLVWIMTVTTTAFALFLILGEAFWWE
ncbi:hypothetical protein GCM10009841_36090 [Microlunatus panaciterrae]|uniref:Uncharacterized protein n=1 Tax=Microlunatus panaciterrae TaxID=400768 RepID=A0ABS2RGY1_9ACTN|nr:hypothetical protein [Microlunatus panaciterrae]MBM7798269.1 hypothetical protein [Microlunatus panaciterrae]